MLQIILISIGGLIGLFLLIALLTKKTFFIVSTIMINRPKTDVFEYVKHLKNQEKYSKWVMTDPNVELTYTGEDGTVGFVAAWKSEMKNVGIGEHEIKSIVEGERYDVEIRFKKPFEGISQAFTTVETVLENQTKITTTFTSRTPFPMNLMTAMMCKMLQRDMDQNSANLKAILEK